MEEHVASTLEIMISRGDKEVLVETVKLIQKLGMNGDRGDWKKFLNTYDKKLGASLSDPSKRSVDVLSAFIKSFTQEEDLEFLANIFRQYRDHKDLEKHSKESVDEESPQQRLVRLTMEHPLYKKHYSFQCYDFKNLVVAVKTMKPNRMLSVDCEMVLCHDGTEEVVEVCVVDKKLKVKLKSLVKPNKPVADYRTEITGVSAEDLEGVTCSLTDIQRSMKKLLSNETILVGHSVHNDLRVLKIVHQLVIDTAYIFKYSKGPPTFTPSLNSLCKAVLGFEVRKKGEPHDCRKDAEAAMKLVLAKLEHGFHDLIDVMGVTDFNPAELLLHRIPVEISCQELPKVFPQDIKFDMQGELKIQGKFYSMCAVFTDACEANNAFQRVEGQLKKDSVGRLQKLVYLKLSTGQIISFYLRKMATSSISEDVGSALKITLDSKKRLTTMSSTEVDEGRDSKIQRSGKNNFKDLGLKAACSCSAESCKHAKEFSRLKQEIGARENEIFKLQKILAGLVGGE